MKRSVILSESDEESLKTLWFRIGGFERNLPLSQAIRFAISFTDFYASEYFCTRLGNKNCDCKKCRKL